MREREIEIEGFTYLVFFLLNALPMVGATQLQDIYVCMYVCMYVVEQVQVVVGRWVVR